MDGAIDRIGTLACAWVTVTSTGLPVALAAVTRIVAVRVEALVFAVKLQLMVPEFVPLAPEVIDSQLPLFITAAVQDIVPDPLLDTLNVVDPASLTTFWLSGLTVRLAAAGKQDVYVLLPVPVNPFCVAVIATI